MPKQKDMLTIIRQETKPFTHCFPARAIQQYFKHIFWNTNSKPAFINSSNFLKLWKTLWCGRVILGRNRSKLRGILVMLIALNEKTHPTTFGTFSTFVVQSFSPHRRVLTRRRWFSNLLRATKSFHTRPYDRQFLRRKWCQIQRTEFFNIQDIRNDMRK